MLHLKAQILAKQGGPVLYDIADAPAEVMRWYRELLPSLPEEGLRVPIGLLAVRPRRRL